MKDFRSRRLTVETRLLGVQAVGDFLFALVGLLLGYAIRFQTVVKELGPEGKVEFSNYLPIIVLGALLLSITYVYLGLYTWRVLVNISRTISLLIKGTTFWFVLFLLITLVLKFEPSISRLFIGISWISTLLTILLWRLLFYFISIRFRWVTLIRRRILLIGWSHGAERLVDALTGDTTYPYSIEGIIQTPGMGSEEETRRMIGVAIPILGNIEELEKLVDEKEVDIVVVMDLDLSSSDLYDISLLCERKYLELKMASSMFQTFQSSLHLETIAGFPLLGGSELRINQIQSRILKRSMDLAGGLALFAASAPVMLVLMILIKRESPGPVIFRQTRTGKGGRPFTILKLRSMRLDAEKLTGSIWATKNDPRRLRIGSFMREWNLDELPQFWNVIKGEMSLVGPRPERPELIENFERTIPHYNPRHMVKPGITGWAQVNGLRGDTSLTERIRYDLFYIENWSVAFDIQILVMTLIKRENAY